MQVKKIGVPSRYISNLSDFRIDLMFKRIPVPTGSKTSGGRRGRGAAVRRAGESGAVYRGRKLSSARKISSSGQ
jgi:hypothetical protein